MSSAADQSTIQRASDDAQSLRDEMVGLKRRTTDETVEATVTRFVDGENLPMAPSDRIRVEYETAYGDTDAHTFDKPDDEWTADYAFVRWVRAHGYTAESFPRMEADDATVPTRYETATDIALVVPEQPVPLHERAANLMGTTPTISPTPRDIARVSAWTLLVLFVLGGLLGGALGSVVGLFGAIGGLILGCIVGFIVAVFVDMVFEMLFAGYGGLENSDL